MKRFSAFAMSITLMCSFGTTLAEPAKQKLSKLDGALIKKLSLEVASELNDPSSAQFRNVTLNRNTRTVCGEVNAKNAYGGYVGFRWFARTEGVGGAIFPPTPGVPREKIIELLNRQTDENGEPNKIQCALK